MYNRCLITFIIIIYTTLWSSLFFAPSTQKVVFSPELSLRDLALENDIKPGKLKHELGLESVPGRMTAAELGLQEQRIREALIHLRDGPPAGTTAAALLACALLCGLAVILLAGRTMTTAWKLCLLCAAVLVTGFWFGKSINPMVGLVKLCKAFFGVEPGLRVWMTVTGMFLLMAVIGTKTVCGWACPFGALQELMFKFPVLKKFKTNSKLPFWLTNSIRSVLFIVFIYALFSNLFGLRSAGRAIYHPVNPFNLFEFNFSSMTVTLYIGAVLIAGLVWYRPHCHLVCPFGFVSWLAERLSLFRIRIDRNKCTDCGRCVEACPGRAMQGLYQNRFLPPDCFSCGECLRACTFDALSYTTQRK